MKKIRMATRVVMRMIFVVCHSKNGMASSILGQMFNRLGNAELSERAG